VFPGHNAEAHTKTAIMLLSPRALRRTRYGHTGWRKIGNEWVFLHAGGAITAAGLIDEVETELSGGLELFRLLAPPVGEELVTPIHATLNLLALGRAKLMFPLIAAVFRAILGDADFYLFLVGTTGLFKSEAAALAQQHFGPGLDSRHLPGSWTSTANALEDLAFRAKDALLVVDDFKPSGDTFADAKLHQQADRLLRAQGNGSARQRMRADCSLRAPRPPRGLMLCTGEDVPHGESLRARGLVLQVAPGDIEITRLTRCQQDAAAGLYPQVSSAFCRWAASRLPALKKELRERAASLRPKFAGAHSRSPGMLAELFVSFEIFLRFAVETTQEGALTKDEGKELLATCEGALKQAGAEHSALLKVSEPTGRYLSLLSAALASGAAHLADKDGNAPRSAGACGWRLEYSGTLSSYKAMGTRIGWVEGPDVYLEAEAAYQVAQEHAVKGGGVAVTEQALRKRLRDKGLLVSTDASRNTLTIRKTFNGGRQNVLHLRAADLGISETPDEPDHSNIPV
jgi:hypothetical protein